MASTSYKRHDCRVNAVVVETLLHKYVPKGLNSLNKAILILGNIDLGDMSALVVLQKEQMDVFLLLC